MAKKKQAAVTEEAAPVVVTGHVIKPRYREFECDWVELEEGEVPFCATVRRNLSLGEVESLPDLNSMVWGDVWSILTPHVIAWNHMALNIETGKIEPVPPPSVAGADALKTLDPELIQWLYLTLQTAHLGGTKGVLERKNASGPSGDGPEQESSAD